MFKARIAWAFLELCDANVAIEVPHVASALGGVLATIEGSLHRWERGLYQSSSKFDIETGTDGSLFSSFFGKSRLNSKLLDQRIGDQEDEDDYSLTSVFHKAHLPLLGDLTVDPSTLCKVACGFARLSAKHPYVTGSWTMTRVAVRLLSSKNARLMKECSLHDIVRLCEAAVLSEVAGHGRELIIGLFSRKVVQVLNEGLDPSYDRENSSSESVDLAIATPSEISTLAWTLGELGVRHATSDEARQTAHKKLRLITDKPLLTKDQISSLNVSSLLRLVSQTFVSKA